MKDTEKTLLGGLIADPKSFHLVDGLITADSFYTTNHQRIYAAIKMLVEADAPVDLVSLKNGLNGSVPIGELVDITTTPTINIEYYAERVADDYAQRQAKIAMLEAVSEIERGGGETASIIATVQRRLDDTLPQGRDNSDLWPDIMGTIDRVGNASPDSRYLPTGFGKIDMHASLRPGNLTLIAADPGAGKTSYLLCVARHIAKKDKRVLFFTLEMTREQILENIIAQELKYCHQDMINGKLTDHQISHMVARAADFERLKMGIVEGRWSISKLRHKVITEARTKGVDLLIVDSLGKVKLPEGMSKTGDLYKIYDIICEELVDLAVEMKIPVLLSHHLNKDGGKREKNNRPTMGSLNQAGDKWTHNVILIHREYLHTKNQEVEREAEFIVGKARDGRVGIIPAVFDGPTKTFFEEETHRELPAVMAGAYQHGN